MMKENPSAHSSSDRDKQAGLLKRIVSSLLRHWEWKILCLVLAVFLWGSVIGQDTSLTREKVIRGVPITIVNAAALQRNGFIAVEGLTDLEDVSIRVEVPVRYYNTVTASNYSVRLDLSQITHAGEQTLTLSPGTSAYGSISEIYDSQISLTVEEYVTRSRIPVRIRTIGTVPEGYYANAATADINEVTVSGPASVVNQVARCIVEYTMPTLANGAGTEYTSSPISFFTAQDEELSKRDLTVTVDSWGLDSITVQQTFYPMYEVPVSGLGLVQGEPAEGYRIKSVTYSPASIYVADMDIASHTGDYVYLSGSVDVTGLTRSTVVPLQVSRPGGFVYISTDVVYVSVEIVPEGEE